MLPERKLTCSIGVTAAFRRISRELGGNINDSNICGLAMF